MWKLNFIWEYPSFLVYLIFGKTLINAIAFDIINRVNGGINILNFVEIVKKLEKNWILAKKIC